MIMADIAQISKLQRELTVKWHEVAPDVTSEGFLGLVEENHLRNFNLWHEEDKARREDMGFEYVYHAKRAIDKNNQERNNFMEKMDQWLCNQIGSRPKDCPMHTETPGMIIDRLSILALKEYHMWEETQRKDVDDDHLKTCSHKLGVIRQQLEDLVNSLQGFLKEVEAGKRGFKVYFQFKMYNDPSLNPQLYKQQNQTA